MGEGVAESTGNNVHSDTVDKRLYTSTCTLQVSTEIQRCLSCILLLRVTQWIHLDVDLDTHTHINIYIHILVHVYWRDGEEAGGQVECKRRRTAS